MFEKEYVNYEEKFLAEAMVYTNGESQLFFDEKLTKAVEPKHAEEIHSLCRAGVLRVVTGGVKCVPVVYSENETNVIIRIIEPTVGELGTITLTKPVKAE